MKITILNGNPTQSRFDEYLNKLKAELEKGNNQVTKLDLRDLSLKYCTGCFDCWTKTPGICDTDIASQEMDRAIINSDFTLWAAPLIMGFPSALLKMALDKHLPLIHPYMVVDQHEAHHLKRYKNYPRVGLLVEQENDTDDRDLEIVKDIFSRTALNLKSKLDFIQTSKIPTDDLAQKIMHPRIGPHLYQKTPQLIPGETIIPPKRITVFNGSPRGKNGNTPIMLSKLMEGFGGDYEIHHLVQIKKVEEQVKAFQEAECVWLGFPLYTDAMPGLVKNFIEDLEPFQDNGNNPPMGFLVQSGFPEGIHSRYVEQYLESLAKRLGSPYLGTIIKGSGEGTRIKAETGNMDLFVKLDVLGKGFAESGQLSSSIHKSLARPERYPRVLGPVYRWFLNTKMAHNYFDSMLKVNNAFDRRNDQPFLN